MEVSVTSWTIEEVTYVLKISKKTLGQITNEIYADRDEKFLAPNLTRSNIRRTDATGNSREQRKTAIVHKDRQ